MELPVLDNVERLRRFCFTGGFEPVYCHNYKIIIERNIKELRTIAYEVNASAMIKMLKELFAENDLPRRDELILIYVVYLSCPLREEPWRKSVRLIFTDVIKREEDLFLFAKYAIMFKQVANRSRGYTRTARKAIESWYRNQKLETIVHAWLFKKKVNGFDHGRVLKNCNSNHNIFKCKTIDEVESFFEQNQALVHICKNNWESEIKKEIEKEKQYAQKEQEKKEKMKEQNEQQEQKGKKRTVRKRKMPKKVVWLGTNRTESGNATGSTKLIDYDWFRELRPLINSLSKIIDKNLGDLIIDKQDPNCMPKRWLEFPVIAGAAVKKMSYAQVLKNLGLFARKHRRERCVGEALRATLTDVSKMASARVYPFDVLLSYKKINPKHMNESLKNDLNKFIMKSYGRTKPMGLKICLTLNVQCNYLKRKLPGIYKFLYLEAITSLAFSIYKSETDIDVFYWNNTKSENGELKTLPWQKEMNYTIAQKCIRALDVGLRVQKLKTPILKARDDKKSYDLFINIVPCATWGNRGQQSTDLNELMQSYRADFNPNSKYIIINARRRKASMRYSTDKNESILEICGFNANTTKIMRAFALDKFR